MKEMVNTEKIVGYLKKTYQPDAVIVYGSFADGSANLNSDFDALIIAGKEKAHDSSIVDGVVLDVFVYPAIRRKRFQRTMTRRSLCRFGTGKPYWMSPALPGS